MIATQCASFVGTWDSVHKRRELALVIIDLRGFQSANSKHIDDNFSSYEGISLTQNSQSKLQLSDLDSSFY